MLRRETLQCFKGSRLGCRDGNCTDAEDAELSCVSWLRRKGYRGAGIGRNKELPRVELRWLRTFLRGLLLVELAFCVSKACPVTFILGKRHQAMTAFLRSPNRSATLASTCQDPVPDSLILSAARRLQVATSSANRRIVVFTSLAFFRRAISAPAARHIAAI